MGEQFGRKIICRILKILSLALRLLIFTPIILILPCFHFLTSWTTKTQLHLVSLLLWRVAIASSETCPAVKVPNSNKYFSYDWRYQAATLEEAVANFIDLSVGDPVDARTLDSSTPVPGIRLSCDTLECIDCLELLSSRLKALDPTFSDHVLPVRLISGVVVDKNRQRICKGLQEKTATNKPKPQNQQLNSGREIVKNDLANVSPPFTAVNIEDLTKISDILTNPIIVDQNLSIPVNNGAQKRPKREASSGGGTKLGISTNLACSYKKGDPVTDQSSLVGLCNLCWSLRVLPASYFPRYVNELTCDFKGNNTTCLSGYGKCRERCRQTDVMLSKNATAKESAAFQQQWAAISIAVPASCECMLPISSALYNLVKN